MLRYSFLCMIISYVRLYALSCILPLPSGAYFACLACLSKSSALSKMGGLWALTFTPVTCDFRVLSKRGNCRHPIFDRPQDLDVTV